MKIAYTLFFYLFFTGFAFGQTGHWFETIPSKCKAFIPFDFDLQKSDLDEFQISWNGGCKDGLVTGMGAIKIFISKFLINTHVANYIQGKATGLGVTKSGNARYVGEFKESRWHGQGILTLHDGQTILGEWANNYLDGRGINYDSNGSISRVGIFKNNFLVTSKPIDPNSFTLITKLKNAETKIHLSCHVNLVKKTPDWDKFKQQYVTSIINETKDVEVIVSQYEISYLRSIAIFGVDLDTEGQTDPEEEIFVISTPSKWEISYKAITSDRGNNFEHLKKVQIDRVSGLLNFFQKDSSGRVVIERNATGVCSRIDTSKKKF